MLHNPFDAESYIREYEINLNTNGMDSKEAIASCFGARSNQIKDEIDRLQQKKKVNLKNIIRGAFFGREALNRKLAQLKEIDRILQEIMNFLANFTENNKTQNNLEFIEKLKKASTDLIIYDPAFSAFIKQLSDQMTEKNFDNQTPIIELDAGAEKKEIDAGAEKKEIDAGAEKKEIKEIKEIDPGVRKRIVDIKRMLRRKNIPENIFDEKADIPLADFRDHVGWAFEHIYKFPYKSFKPKEGEPNRLHHGIQHVTRASAYVPVIANLFQLFGNEDAKQLSEQEISLLQLAVLFHDSAREGEDEDLWDNDSAVFFYYYVTKVLGVDSQTAVKFAEAIANKDLHKEGYFQLNVLPDGNVYWELSQHRDKNIYQKIIHDADCLDIIRARFDFDGTYLDLYKDHAHNDEQALRVVAELIAEARHLVVIQGDRHGENDLQVKLKYENADAYQHMLNDIEESGIYYSHRVIPRLSQRMSNDQNIELSELIQPHRKDHYFVRGIHIPTGKGKDDKTYAEIEIQKAIRRPGIPTTSSKLYDRETKHGNPKRSISYVGYGAGVYSAAGFVFKNPGIETLHGISHKDVDSGYGKRSKGLPESLMNAMNLTNKKPEEKEAAFKLLERTILLGGPVSRKHDYGNLRSFHVEIIGDIRDFDAIYFTNDPNAANFNINTQTKPFHQHAPILQAIYLQQQFQLTDRDHRLLPIMEYSGLHNFMKTVDPEQLTNEKIKQYWISMVRDYLKKIINDPRANTAIFNYSSEGFLKDRVLQEEVLNHLKVLAMYGVTVSATGQSSNGILPADILYDPKLREEINAEILKTYLDYREEYEKSISNVLSEKIAVTDNKLFYRLINSSFSPELAKKIETGIMEQVKTLFADDNTKQKTMADMHTVIEKLTQQFGEHNFKQINLNEYANEKSDNKIKIYDRLMTNPLIRLFMLSKSNHMDNEITFIKNLIQEYLNKKIEEVLQEEPEGFVEQMYKLVGYIQNISAIQKVFDLPRPGPCLALQEQALTLIAKHGAENQKNLINAVGYLEELLRAGNLYFNNNAQIYILSFLENLEKQKKDGKDLLSTLDKDDFGAFMTLLQKLNDYHHKEFFAEQIAIDWLKLNRGCRYYVFESKLTSALVKTGVILNDNVFLETIEFAHSYIKKEEAGKKDYFNFMVCLLESCSETASHQRINAIVEQVNHEINETYNDVLSQLTDEDGNISNYESAIKNFESEIKFILSSSLKKCLQSAEPPASTQIQTILDNIFTKLQNLSIQLKPEAFVNSLFRLSNQINTFQNVEDSFFQPFRDYIKNHDLPPETFFEIFERDARGVKVYMDVLKKFFPSADYFETIGREYIEQKNMANNVLKIT